MHETVDLHKYENLTERKATRRLSLTNQELRIMEFDQQIFLEGFPELLKLASYDEIVEMKTQQLLLDTEIAEKYGISTHDAKMLVYWWHFSWKPYPEEHKKFVARKMELHQQALRDKYDGKMPFQVPEIRAKAEKTHMKKYGSRSPFGSPEVRSKSKDTLMVRYGVDNALKSPNIKQKALDTMVERYGAPYTLQSKELVDKVRRTTKKRYGVSNVFVEGDIRDGFKDIFQSRYGVDYPGQSPEIRRKMDESIKKSGRGGSHQEHSFKNFLEDSNLVEGDDFIWHDYSVIGKELDFYFPKKSLAVEFSPSFTHHSNEYRFVYQGKDRNYHINKRRACDSKGIELITLFDWNLKECGGDWENKTLSLLRAKILNQFDAVFYGRNVVIEEKTSASSKRSLIDFTRDNHLQGSVRSTWWFGIYAKKDHSLIGTFSVSPVKGRRDSIELKRVCWKTGVQVRYGLSKIVSHIAKRFPDMETLLSYSDCNMGNGSSYGKAGFDFVGETSATLHFINPNHHPTDQYSWSIATPWSAKSGVIAHKLHPMDIDYNEARRVVEEELPHRGDDGVGYNALYDSGNRKWSFDLAKMR